jgi:hypothetical protein
VHDKVRHPCPFAEELECGKTFSWEQGAKKHGKKVHDKVRHPCPHKIKY